MSSRVTLEDFLALRRSIAEYREEHEKAQDDLMQNMHELQEEVDDLKRKIEQLGITH